MTIAKTQFLYGQFPLGQLVATPGALQAFEGNRQDPMGFIFRHANGDWGNLDPEDRAANDRAAQVGERLLSAYELEDGEKIWIITEADRKATTILLPEEY